MYLKKIVLLMVSVGVVACGRTSSDVFRDQSMDFGTIQTIAVMPFANQTREQTAADRVRDVFINRLLSTGGVYALPIGEVRRGTSRVGIADPTCPSPEEVVKFAGVVKADAVITGDVKEYGEVRSGTASATMIAISMQMMEAQTGRVVWSASATQGGVDMSDRLFGGGGEPMNIVTEKAVNDIIHKLFK